MKMNVQNLDEADGYFKFRMMVPKDLKGRYGKNYVIKGIGRIPKFEAMQKAELLNEEFRALWEAMRSGTPHKQYTEIVDAFSKQLDQSLDTYLEQLLSTHGEDALEEYQSWANDKLDEWRYDGRGLNLGAFFGDDFAGTDIDMLIADTAKGDARIERRIRRIVEEGIRRVNETVNAEILGQDIPTKKASTARVEIQKNLSAPIYDNDQTQNPPPTPSRRMTIDEVVGDMLEVQRSRGHDMVSLLRRTAKEWQAFCGSHPIDAYGDQAALAYREHLQGLDRADNTKKTKFNAVKQVFTHAVERGWLTRSPLQGIIWDSGTPDKPPDHDKAKAYTTAEVQAILTRLDDATYMSSERAHAKPSRRWATWLIALHGIRVNEACQLRRSDIDLNRGTFRVSNDGEQMSLKRGDKARTIPLDSHLLNHPDFKAFVLSRDGEERLFPDCTYTKGKAFIKQYPSFVSYYEEGENAGVAQSGLMILEMHKELFPEMYESLRQNVESEIAYAKELRGSSDDMERRHVLEHVAESIYSTMKTLSE